MSTIAAPIDFAAIIGDVARELLGEPTGKQSGPVLRWGSSGKIRVNTKLGVFSDYAAGAKGGLLDMVLYFTGLSSKRDALRWLADRGFIDRPDTDLTGSIQRAIAPRIRVDDDDAPARHRDAAERAAWIWERSTEAKPDHPYLLSKGITLEGLPVRNYRGTLVVPLRNATGALVGLQFIGQDGSKRFSKGSNMAGAFATIGEDLGEGRVFVEGLATGATVHAATGRQIIVAMNAGNLAAVVKAIGHPGDLIAADNDNAPKPDDTDARAIGTYGTGHRAALALELPVYLPTTPGADFNDIGTEATAAIFARTPISETPVFDAWAIERKAIDAPADELLRELSQTTEPEAAARLALTIGTRLLRRVPAQLRLADIRVQIETAAAPGSLHPATLDGILYRLSLATGHRQRAAMASTVLPLEMIDKGQHAPERPRALPQMTDADFTGVIMVRAPMASGKTQHIGRPLADYAARTGRRMLALTHRRSLVMELALRLKLEHYGDLTREDAEFAPNLATCLPSIAREDHAPLIDRAEIVFIDEFSQCLRFLESHTHCKTKTASNQGVYNKLREIIANAECVVVADAGLNERDLRFLESCRPGECFRIIDVPAPRDAGISATYRYGTKAPAAVVSAALAELEAGGRVWIATESRRRAARLGELFESNGYKPLVLHSENTGNEQQRAFLTDADKESRKYRVVIASPVVASGLSIEHRNAKPGERFTLGCFIGGGHAVTPADAAQQLRRVRYLDRFEIGFIPNNAIGDQNIDNLLHAAETAAALEQRPATASDFDRFVADIRVENQNRKADFAAGLIWNLQAAGWTLKRALDETEDQALTDRLKAASEQAEAKRRTLILSAPVISHEQAAEIEAERFRTPIQAAMLEGYRIRTQLGITEVNEAVLDFWEDGAVLARLDRLAAFRGLAPEGTDAELTLTSRRFHQATVRAYRQLFAGIDPTAPDFLTPEVSEQLLDRIMDRRDLLAHLGIVGPKFSQYREDRQGHRLPMPRPKYATREITDLFARMGLELTARRVRIDAEPVPDGADSLTANRPIWHNQSEPKKRRMVRLYSLDAASLERVSTWLERRAKARGLVPVAAPPVSDEPSPTEDAAIPAPLTRKAPPDPAPDHPVSPQR